MTKNKHYRSGNLWLCNYCNKMATCVSFTHKLEDDPFDKETYYCCCQSVDCMRKFIKDKNRLKGKDYKLPKYKKP